MDIKSKSNNKYLITILALIITLTASMVMVGQYKNIKSKVDKNNYNVFEEADYLEEIERSKYVLYQRILEKKDNSKIDPAENFLSEDTIDKIVNSHLGDEEDLAPNSIIDYKTNIKEEFNSSFNEWNNKLNYSLKNLRYYAIDKESNIKVSNTTDELSILANKSEVEKDADGDNKSKDEKADDKTNTEDIIENIRSKYMFYMVMNFDNEGNMTITDSYGANKDILEERFINLELNAYDYKLEPIKNTTIVYAIPQDLEYYDGIRDELYYGEISQYSNASRDLVKIISVILIIVVLLIPYNKLKDLIGFERISKIPIEISIAVLLFMISFFDIDHFRLIKETLSGDLVNNLILNNISRNTSLFLVNGINIVYWAMYFLIIFIGVILAKHIWSVGIRNYIMNKTLTGMLLRYSYKKLRKAIYEVEAIDLKEKQNRFIIRILILNLLVLILISCLWFFGIIVAIIYTIALFFIVRKYIRNVVNKYDKLLEATNKIANGNLDTNIDEDLGVFEPIKEKLGSIQTGFKRAVEEEVKSQKMKTELISNVSHDLKTPLTSIITYVDLLKDESIDEETRKSYINTLDRKSQRLQTLIEDLFEMSKANSGDISLNIVDVDIVSLMKQTLLELKDHTSKSSLIIKQNYPQEKVILRLDSQRTFRVFENLIMNISKYSMPNSRVYIDIIDRDSQVDIILKNMSATEIDFDVNNIVERFVRGDKSRNTEGSGLGLAIAKSFVELQKGKLDVAIDLSLIHI